MNYENKVVTYFNQFFKNRAVLAISHRLKQAKFCNQICDILVDSKKAQYYFAIECKTTKYGLFFSSNFSNQQIENISVFIKKSGRIGILALKDRGKDYLVPWSIVEQNYNKGKKGVNAETINPWEINIKDNNTLKETLEKIYNFSL